MMRSIITVLCLLLAGCAAPSRSPSELMSLKPGDMYERVIVVDLPIRVAYRNFLDVARPCYRNWFAGNVDADPYETDRGFARVSFTVTGGMLPDFTMAATDFYPLSDDKTRVVSRTAYDAGEWMLPRLKGWVEGADKECTAVKPS